MRNIFVIILWLFLFCETTFARLGGWGVDTTGDVGQFVSGTLGIGSDRQHCCASYYDATNGDLKYVEESFGTPMWNVQRVDTTGNTGLYTSIYVDTASRYPHISYYDATNGDLKHAYRDGTNWVTEKIDTLGNVGMYSSIKVDALSHIHISYYDATKGDLRYAYWNGSDWDIQKIDTLGDVGRYTSLSLDSINYPHISYYDSTNGNLKHSYWDGNKWNVEIVDSAGDVGKYSCMIALCKNFEDTTLCISYYDVTNKDLKCAKWDSCLSGWNIQKVDTEGNVGMYSSIIIGWMSGLEFLYYDSTNDIIRFKGWQSSYWGTVVDSGIHTNSFSPIEACGYLSEIFWYDGVNNYLLFTDILGSIEESSNINPPSTSLRINQNPFSKSTIITYSVPEYTLSKEKSASSFVIPAKAGIHFVSLAIYDLSGRCVKTLVNEQKPAGYYSTTLNANELKTGIYFVKLTAGNIKETKKLILVK
ncbi:MAG: T9SS type A sorting domain-containing protein [bacterium]|nr:T9SS type A sorting domain-containing protein [bacterium]